MTIEIQVTNNGNRNAVIHEVTESSGGPEGTHETYVVSHVLTPKETKAIHIWKDHFLKVMEED